MNTFPEQARLYGDNAAWLRRMQADMQPFFEALAENLEGSMPGGVTVIRSRTKLFGPLRADSLTVVIGDRAYTAAISNGTVSCRRAPVVGGVVKKEEDVTGLLWGAGEILARGALNRDRDFASMLGAAGLHVTRGVQLQGENMEMLRWMEAMMADIAEHTDRADRAHSSLESFLMA